MFVFTSWLVSHKILYSHTIFLGVARSKLQTLQLIKRKSKVQENNCHVTCFKF